MAQREIQRVEPKSAAKFVSVLCALNTFIFSTFVLLSTPATLQSILAGMIGLSIIMLISGAIAGFISAIVYNAVSETVGGIRIDVS